MAKKMNLPEYYKPLTETYKKLEVNQVFKNYKELCYYLCQPIVKGNSLITQKETFELYFEYEKEGNKIIITNVYDLPLFNYSSGMYQNILQKLILNRLIDVIKNGDRKLIISNSQLMEQLNMVNRRYREYMLNRMDLKENLNVSYHSINDFYRLTNSKLSGLIMSTMNSLRKGSYLMCDKVTMIKENNGRLIKANDFMKSIILKYEDIVRIELGLVDINDAHVKNMYHEYNRRVLQYINDEMKYLTTEDYRMYYYYEAYDIIIGDRLVNEWTEHNRHNIDNVDCVFKELNDMIISNHKEGYLNRSGLAWDRLLEGDASKSDGYKIINSYVDDGNKLIDYTIKRVYKDIE